MMAPKLTVCIPAYNRPDYLKDALTSLCHQGLTRDELVVAISDDASPTSLDPVVAAFHDRLQINYQRSNTNIGHIANYERVFTMVETPYVTFLPHDDVIASGHLGRALPLMDSNPGTAIVAGLVLCQRYPGAPDSSVHGLALRNPSSISFFEPYLWNRSEWMASALVGSPFNMVGAIFDTHAFSKCLHWKSFPLWHDRVWCAELGLLGNVITLPWICGYYRVSEEQMSRQLWMTNKDEFKQVSIFFIRLCDEAAIPVIQFWIDLICQALPDQRTAFLDLLHRALPDAEFSDLKKECERRLKTHLHLGGRLAKIGLPWPIEKIIRSCLKS